MGKHSETLVVDNQTYDRIKQAALLYLPAFIAFYVAVSEIWGLPYTTEVAGTAAAFDTFLGVLVKVSSKQYHETKPSDGTLNVVEDEDGAYVFLEAESDPSNLKNSQEVTFKVRKDT